MFFKWNNSVVSVKCKRDGENLYLVNKLFLNIILLFSTYLYSVSQNVGRAPLGISGGRDISYLDSLC